MLCRTARGRVPDSSEGGCACVHRLVWLGRGKWDFEHANSVGRRLAGWLLSQLHCLTRSLDFTPERNLNEKRKGRSSRARIPSLALGSL